MRYIFLKLLFVCMIPASLFAGSYVQTHYLSPEEKSTVTKETVNDGAVKDLEDATIQPEIVPQIETAPTPNTIVAPRTFTPPTSNVPEYSNDTSAIEDFKARQEEECQRKTDTYAKCLENFNNDTNKYLACQRVNDDAKERYTSDMESYSRCMDDYEDDVNAYNACLENASESPIRTYCSKPTTMFCHKPMNPYSQYCNKPVNFCTKPYCY